MVKGIIRPEGSTCLNGKGYTSIKVATEEGGSFWKLLHHVVWEKKVGRPKEPNEILYFVDGDITNFDPDNIAVKVKGENSLVRRKAQLIKQKLKIEEELETINKRIESERTIKSSLKSNSSRSRTN